MRVETKKKLDASSGERQAKKKRVYKRRCEAKQRRFDFFVCFVFVVAVAVVRA